MRYSRIGAAVEAAEEAHGAEPEAHQGDGLGLPMAALVDGTIHVQVPAGALGTELSTSRARRTPSSFQSLLQCGPALPQAEQLESGQDQSVVDLPPGHAGSPFHPR